MRDARQVYRLVAIPTAVAAVTILVIGISTGNVAIAMMGAFFGGLLVFLHAQTGRVMKAAARAAGDRTEPAEQPVAALSAPVGELVQRTRHQETLLTEIAARLALPESAADPGLEAAEDTAAASTSTDDDVEDSAAPADDVAATDRVPDEGSPESSPAALGEADDDEPTPASSAPPATSVIGAWSITDRSLVEAVGHLLDLPHAPVVCDIGAGPSTVWFALALARRGDGDCWAFDDDAGRLTTAFAHLEHLCIESFAYLQQCRIVDDELAVEPHLPETVDVIHVCAPEQVGAHPSPDAFADHLRAGTWVIIDSTHRKAGTEAAERWMAMSGIEWEPVRTLGSATLLVVESARAEATPIEEPESVEQAEDSADEPDEQPDATVTVLEPVHCDEHRLSVPGRRGSSDMWLGMPHECRKFGT